MNNDTDTGMNENENEQKPEWPREVCIRQTLDDIAAELGDDYDEDDENGLVATAIIDSMSTIAIESWEDIPDGYELFNKEDEADYQAYLESKHRDSTEDIPHANQAPSPVGTIKASELQHGKFYDCTIDGDLGPEDCSFVQLAIDAKSNRRFVLLGARHLLASNLGYIHKLINMSFNELKGEDSDGSPDAVMGLEISKFILAEDGLLKSASYDCYLDGFSETDVIKFGPTS